MRISIMATIAAAAVAGIVIHPVRAAAQGVPTIKGPVIFGFAVPQIADPTSVSFTNSDDGIITVKGQDAIGTMAAPGLEIHSHIVDPGTGGIFDINRLTFQFDYDGDVTFQQPSASPLHPGYDPWILVGV